MVAFKDITYQTTEYNQLIDITKDVVKAVKETKIKDGVVHIITKHTTTGILVNENLECLQDDILKKLSEMFPEDGDYYHARFLRSYGAMAGNPTGHLKSMVTGNNTTFALRDKKLDLGSAQSIYLGEFDGPQERTITIVVMGE